MKKNDSYSILIVPSDHQKVKRFSLRSWQVRLLLLFVLLIGGAVLVTGTGFFHYRSLYWSMEKARAKTTEFDQQKIELLAKLNKLESSLERTNRFAQKLETVVETIPSKVRQGLGPIESGGWDFLKEGGRIPEEYKYLLTGKYLSTNLSEKIEFLEKSVEALEARIDTAYEQYQEKMVILASTPSIWPTNGWVTSSFGNRLNPITSRRQFHKGYDIAARWGSSVQATADGIVTYAGYEGRFGKVVKLDHGFGVQTIYAHNAGVHVRPGQKVKRGMKIATIGNTGWTTGTHLHYEVRVHGVPVNPRKFILE